ncbi:hypothetical protein [Clostridium kluyveri]|nr:hypothetical protein [Clostridium kluyveri]
MDFALELYKAQSMSLRKICEVTGVARAILCRRIKEMRQNKELKEWV